MNWKESHGPNPFVLLLLIPVFLAVVEAIGTIFAMLLSRRRNPALLVTAAPAALLGGGLTALIVAIDGWQWDWMQLFYVGPLVVGIMGCVQWILLRPADP